MTKHLLWDWNGTLYDDVEICIRIMNAMLSERNLPTMISVNDYHDVFRFPVIEYYRNLGFDFQKESFEELAKLYIDSYYKESRDACLRMGTVQTLESLKQSGIDQLILSASETHMLYAQVDHLRISSYFSAILGENDIYAFGKAGIADRWMNSGQINTGEVIIVGDTVHDYEVSRKIGCRCILVSGGHQKESSLRDTGCPVISSPAQVLSYI